MSTKIKNAGQLVIRAFSEKSSSYSTWAGFQKEAAGRLSGWLPDQIHGPVLEAGAGTGLFTRHLIKKYPDVPIIITDASVEMLLACRQELVRIYPVRKRYVHGSDVTTTEPTDSLPRISEQYQVSADDGYNANNNPKQELRFIVYNPEKEGPYTSKHNLVISALTAQWFGDFGKGVSAMANSVADGGHIILSYLTKSSFPEWANKCSELDIPFTANRLPEAGSGSNVLNSLGFDVRSEHIHITIDYPSAIDFFRSLKMTGASTQLGGFSNRPSDMKRLISAIDQTDTRLDQPKKIKITYGLDVVTGFKKTGKERDVL
jgi:malonyl-CoA O-methyltransferase